MAYNNSIPQPADRLKDSQAAILENFVQIKTLIDINHATFGDANQGKHIQVSLPEQGADPATLANEMAIYSKQSPLTNDSQLFVRNENNGTVTEFTNSLDANEGWTRLPSGILLKWGRFIVAAGGVQTYIYPAGGTIPPFTTALLVIASPSSNDLVDQDFAVRVIDWANLNFRAYFSRRFAAGPAAGNSAATFLAIGV